MRRAPEHTAASFLPRSRSQQALQRASAGCTACHLHERATQTVFGRGPADADLMLVGEQPGDREDRTGVAFIGPAGRVLDDALRRAGIAPDRVYVTNAVKHFKWRPVGKRRLHDRPNGSEIEICKPWLLAEIEMVRPATVVALGATAATSLLGKRVTLGAHRGRVVQAPDGYGIVVTVHPSLLLRVRQDAPRHMAELVDDLRLAARHAEDHRRNRRAG